MLIFIKYQINIVLFFEKLAIAFYCEIFADANAVYLWCIMNEKYELEV